jgi:hypothetical protein
MSSTITINNWLQDAVEAAVLTAVDTQITERVASGLPAGTHVQVFSHFVAGDSYEPYVSWSVSYDNPRPKRQRRQDRVWFEGTFSVTPRDCVKCLLEGTSPEGVPSADVLFKRGDNS